MRSSPLSRFNAAVPVAEVELPRSRWHIWAFVTSTEVSDRR